MATVLDRPTRAKVKGVLVMLDQDSLDRLDSQAEMIGTNRSRLVRQAVEQLFANPPSWWPKEASVV